MNRVKIIEMLVEDTFKLTIIIYQPTFTLSKNSLKNLFNKTLILETLTDEKLE